jgi:hypothetical protein
MIYKKNIMDLEKEVEKIIKLTFPSYCENNWDEIIYDVDGCLSDQYFNLIEFLIVKEKDKILYKATNVDYLRKKTFFDIDHNFNDSLNKLKKATIDLINIFNGE